MPTKLSKLFACLAIATFSCPSNHVIAQERAQAITARDLATLRDIGGLSASPDQRWLAFSIFEGDPDENRYDGAWHILNIATGAVRRIAEAGDFAPSTADGPIRAMISPPSAVWSPDSAWLAYLRRDNGSTQVWRVRRDGARAEQITSNAGDVRSVVYAHDGRRLLFETQRSEAQGAAALAPEARVGFLYDDRFEPIHSPLPTRPADVNSINGTAASQAAPGRQVWVYDFSSRRERLAEAVERQEFAALTSPPHPETGRVFGAQSARSQGGAVAWAEARDATRQGMFPRLTMMVQRPGAAPIACTAPACTADAIDGVWWRSEAEVFFVRREGLRLQDRALYAWNLSTPDAPRLVLRTADGFGAGAAGADFDCVMLPLGLACTYERPNAPRHLVSVSLDTGDVQTLYEPNPSFARFDLGPAPQRIAVRAASGADTYGYLVVPPHRPSARLPLVIVTYTCSGFLRGGTGDEYPVYPLAAQGFAVFCFAAPDDTERWSRLDAASYTQWARGAGVPLRRRVEETLDAAVAELDRMGVIDIDRIGITGLSFGAETVGWAMIHMQGLTGAIASSHPGTGPSSYPLLSSSVRQSQQARGIGSPQQTPERWTERSFTPHVRRVRAPLLINAADHEMLAALGPLTALEDAGRSVEMYVFPDEYHVKWQPAHRLAIYNRNIDWMNFWLQGREDPAPAKAEQYKRWRAMRVKQCELFKGDDSPWYCRQPMPSAPAIR